jgi:NTE family protein
MTLPGLPQDLPGSVPAPTHRRPLALVLMGGGARTAYQVGVLKALAALLRLQPGGDPGFPFPLLVGTSAGALNAAFLAGAADDGLAAFDRLAGFWAQLRSHDVYRLRLPAWVRLSRLATVLQLLGLARAQGAVLDTMPLVDTLHRAVSLPGIEQALAGGRLRAVAVTASSYGSGVHWTFCHTADDRLHRPWHRPGRRAEFQPLTIEHLMASSAIPFLFPATPLWVDGRREYFGDGSMRQVSPLAPALQLGAGRVLAIGVGQPERAGIAGAPPGAEPGLGAIAGHAMASVFHDTLRADVEQAQRLTETLRRLPPEIAATLPEREVDVLCLQPSQSLDAIAQEHLGALPPDLRRVLGGLGALGHAGALASYLLFEPGFVQDLMALGERDAYAHKAQLLAFVTGSAA